MLTQTFSAHFESLTQGEFWRSVPSQQQNIIWALVAGFKEMPLWHLGKITPKADTVTFHFPRHCRDHFTVKYSTSTGWLHLWLNDDIKHHPTFSKIPLRADEINPVTILKIADAILERIPAEIEDLILPEGDLGAIAQGFKDRQDSYMKAKKDAADERAAAIAEAAKPIIYSFADPRLMDRTKYRGPMRFVVTHNTKFLGQSFGEKDIRAIPVSMKLDHLLRDILPEIRNLDITSIVDTKCRVIDRMPADGSIIDEMEEDFSKSLTQDISTDVLCDLLDREISGNTRPLYDLAMQRSIDEYVNDIERAKVAIKRLREPRSWPRMNEVWRQATGFSRQC